MTRLAAAIRPVVVIPAFQPGPPLEALVRTLVAAPDQAVIVVDDGSAQSHEPVFAYLQALQGVTVLRHPTNLGKGCALRTGFAHFLSHAGPACPGVVTADADGQHLPSDILAVADALAVEPDALWLGARTFEGRVPLRSRFGNSLTRQIFHLLLGPALADTQTGLRGIPRGFLTRLTAIESPGYEFELDMLVHAVRNRIRIRDLPIHTVYEPGNLSSHFRPLVDSLKVYYVFVRFLGIGFVTAALDFAVFAVCYALGMSLLGSLATARLFAGSFNFVMNHYLVFQSAEPLRATVPRYLAAVMLHLGIAYLLMLGLIISLSVNTYLAKLLAESVLISASFTLQRRLVFPSRRLAP